MRGERIRLSVGSGKRLDMDLDGHDSNCGSTEDGSDHDTFSLGSSGSNCASTAKSDEMEYKSGNGMHHAPASDIKAESAAIERTAEVPNSVYCLVSGACSNHAADMLEHLVPNPKDTSSQHTSSASLSPCRWHKSASTVGSISADGHVFTKTASGQKARAHVADAAL